MGGGCKYPLLNFQCRWCKRSFLTLAVLRRHAVDKHNISAGATFVPDPSARIECVLCPKILARHIDNLKDHLFKCHREWRVNRYLEIFYTDITKEISGRNWKLIHMNKTKTAEEVREEIVILGIEEQTYKHGDEVMARVGKRKYPLLGFECRWCDQIFTGVKHLKGHAVFVHNISKELKFSVNTSQDFKCPLCSSKVVRNRESIKWHIKLNHRDWTIKKYLEAFYSEIAMVATDSNWQMSLRPEPAYESVHGNNVNQTWQNSTTDLDDDCQIIPEIRGESVLRLSSTLSQQQQEQQKQQQQQQQNADTEIMSESEEEVWLLDDKNEGGDGDTCTTVDNTSHEKSQCEKEFAVQVSERGEKDIGEEDKVVLCPKCSIYGVTFPSVEAVRAHIEKQHPSLT